MSRQQAKRCTRKELAYLSFWRSHGFMIGIDDPIPLNTMTPPSFATRRPVLNVVIAVVIIACVLAAGGYWLGKAAKII
ncbi:hypothetical protein D3C78_943940 [compost metagenome]